VADFKCFGTKLTNQVICTEEIRAD